MRREENARIRRELGLDLVEASRKAGDTVSLPSSVGTKPAPQDDEADKSLDLDFTDWESKPLDLDFTKPGSCGA